MATKRLTKAEKAEVRAKLKEALAPFGPEGSSTLEIRDCYSRPSSSGRTHYLEVRGWHAHDHDGGRPSQGEWFNRWVSESMGLRLSSGELLMMGGYGYSREQQIAEHLAAVAGHPLWLEGSGGMGSCRGWYPGEPDSERCKAFFKRMRG